MRIAAPLNSHPCPELQWIEVATSLQIPSFQIIGLASPEVAEARERIRAAIMANDFEFPRRKVVVNLSPASVRKRGTGIDLSMALAILAASEPLPAHPGWTVVAWGELSLDGTVKPAGQLTRVVYAAWRAGASHLLVSALEFDDAFRKLEWIRACQEFTTPPPVLLAVPDLRAAWRALQGTLPSAALPALPAPLESGPRPHDALLLPLPPLLERVVTLSAIGSHHLLLLGPRGTGKSHALDWLIALQSPAPPGARLVQSLLSELVSARVESSTPVRRISAHTRPGALIGGAYPAWIRPGEFSLAHGGLLIADELPEWARDSREALREPMERGTVTLTRSNGVVELPSRFTLAANGNLCPCGGWPPELPLPEAGSDAPAPSLCNCPRAARNHYLRRISGPVLDRIDLAVLIGAASPPRGRKEDPLPELRTRASKAREQATSWWGAPPGLLSGSETEALLKAHPDWERTLREVVPFLNLRSRHKIIRVALSIACLEAKRLPDRPHFIEASCYRPERMTLLS